MSDHLSGPRALADPAIDLTDLYAFPSPSRPGHLVLVMNVFPNARPPALFSDAASYRFRIRPVTITASGPGSLFDVGTDEYALTCTFAAPVAPDGRGQSVQKGTCILPKREAVSFRVNDEQGATPTACASSQGCGWIPSSWTCLGRWKRGRPGGLPSKHRAPTR